MKKHLLDLIICPFCGGSLDPGATDRNRDEIEFGILTCRCGRYPLLAGIPILRDPTASFSLSLVKLIEAGKLQEALLAALSPPKSPELAAPWIKALPSGFGLIRLKHLDHRRGLARWQETALELMNGRDTKACEFLAFCFRNNPEAYNYFALRFGQPRQLVALSLASIINKSDGPVLDLACGCGHLTRSLSRPGGACSTIGMDRCFFVLYVARRWIAPEAGYICGSADAALPFNDDAFSACFCSDAFHYFLNKKLAVREMKRVTGGRGPIILSWVHNAFIRQPHDGLPLIPEHYRDLFGDMPCRMVSDKQVLTCYRKKLGPPLAESAPLSRLRETPLLSMVGSQNEELFRDYGPFEEWPHASGPVSLNPLYQRNGAGANGHAVLHRRFPSAFFQGDHPESCDYLPETVEVPAGLLNNLPAPGDTPALQRLVEQCVFLSLPECYI